jgi:hypothetical protein
MMRTQNKFHGGHNRGDLHSSAISNEMSGPMKLQPYLYIAIHENLKRSFFLDVLVVVRSVLFVAVKWQSLLSTKR